MPTHGVGEEDGDESAAATFVGLRDAAIMAEMLRALHLVPWMGDAPLVCDRAMGQAGSPLGGGRAHHPTMLLLAGAKPSRHSRQSIGHHSCANDPHAMAWCPAAFLLGLRVARTTAQHRSLGQLGYGAN